MVTFFFYVETFYDGNENLKSFNSIVFCHFMILCYLLWISMFLANIKRKMSLENIFKFNENIVLRHMRELMDFWIQGIRQHVGIWCMRWYNDLYNTKKVLIIHNQQKINSVRYNVSMSKISI